MFEFKLEPEIPLLTVVRTGLWTLETVTEYERALRQELSKLQRWGPATSFIVDIRLTKPQPTQVADALRHMVAGLGHLHAARTAVVTTSGLAKLQARRIADDSAEVFTSMVLARDWVMRRGERTESGNVIYNDPSDVEVEGHSVRVHGPANVDVSMTPGAALETAKRIGDAAVESLINATGDGAASHGA